jgi:hypothetical protein
MSTMTRRDDRTETLLNAVRRRLWLQGLIDRGWLGFMAASCLLALAAVLHTFHAPLTLSWWGPAVLLPLAVATLAAAFSRPSLAASARAADRWFDTHDLLTAAWHLRSQTPRPASAAALVVLDQASRVAADPPRSLPPLGISRHPLPTAFAVAVAATSLFFLSLQGAASSGMVPNPMPDETVARGPAAADPWLDGVETGLPAAVPAAEGSQAMRESPGSSPLSSNGPTSQTSPAPDVLDPDESGTGTRSDALQPAKGPGAGRVASDEVPSAPGRETSEGIVTLDGLELVAVQRRSAGEAVAIDRATGAELIPSGSGPVQPGALSRSVPAARAAKEPVSPGGGPAHRALQAHYFEETSHRD